MHDAFSFNPITAMGGVYEKVVSNWIWRLCRLGNSFGFLCCGGVVGAKLVLVLAAGQCRNIEFNRSDRKPIGNIPLG